MGQLRDRMEQDLKLKGVSPATIRNYLIYCRKFAAFYMRSPEQLGAAEVRAFLLHQFEVEQLAYGSYRQVYAALKFLYSVPLGRPDVVSRIPFPRRLPTNLPKVLTVAELTAFFAALRKPKYRALFMTCYAAGLRLGEVCHLRVTDIDSARKVIHVRTGKGGKERLTVLSPRLSLIVLLSRSHSTMAERYLAGNRFRASSNSSRRSCNAPCPAPGGRAALASRSLARRLRFMACAFSA